MRCYGKELWTSWQAVQCTHCSCHPYQMASGGLNKQLSICKHFRKTGRRWFPRICDDFSPQGLQVQLYPLAQPVLGLPSSSQPQPLHRAPVFCRLELSCKHSVCSTFLPQDLPWQCVSIPVFMWKLHGNQQTHWGAARAVVKRSFSLSKLACFSLSVSFFGSHQLMTCPTQPCTHVPKQWRSVCTCCCWLHGKHGWL